MRVSTTQFQRQQVNAMLDQQSQLSRTELQLATGRRILTPADDPKGAAAALDLNHTVAVTKQYDANADFAVSRQSLEDSTLGAVTTLLQRARDLAIQSNNSTLSNRDRDAVAAEVRERLDELLGLANTRDANGEYLFSGYSTDTQPFAANSAGGFTYSGDQGQRFLQVGPSFQVAVGDSGFEVFTAIKNGNGLFQVQEGAGNTGSGVIAPVAVTDVSAWQSGNGPYVVDINAAGNYTVTDGGGAGAVVASGTYQSGAAISFDGIQVGITGAPAAGDSFTVSASTHQDVFTTLQNLVNALETDIVDDASRARFGNAVGRFLTDVDQAMDNIAGTRARVGARLNAIDSQRAVNQDMVLYAQENLSAVQDLDYVEAASRMQLQLVGLQAAQQAFVRVQGLTLFNFL